MIEIDKALWYDWHGQNVSWFEKINSFHSDTYDTLMILISQLGESHKAPYYLAILALWALGCFAVQKIRSEKGAGHYLLEWVAVFIVLAVSLKCDKLIIDSLKGYFAYPRPYLALGPQDVHVLQYRAAHNDDDFMSFPSGHVSLVTVFIAGLWPVLSMGMRGVGVFMIALMGWSRMAVGMHFPADVLGGFLITLAITLAVRAVIYSLLRLMNVRC